ncbi:MAG: Hsp20/alpha crystallin family protein [Rhodothalassiaceae bacterium]
MADTNPLAERRGSQSAADGEPHRGGLLYRPDADIYETADRLVVIADMPGVAPEDIEVTLERTILRIHGHVAAIAPDGFRRIYAEYSEGDYERAFRLSEAIDADRIEARLADGVLRLDLPKARQAQARSIDVKAG